MSVRSFNTEVLKMKEKKRYFVLQKSFLTTQSFTRKVYTYTTLMTVTTFCGLFSECRRTMLEKGLSHKNT